MAAKRLVAWAVFDVVVYFYVTTNIALVGLIIAGLI
jgi:hypothetical protein